MLLIKLLVRVWESELSDVLLYKLELRSQVVDALLVCNLEGVVVCVLVLCENYELLKKNHILVQHQL